MSFSRSTFSGAQPADFGGDRPDLAQLFLEPRHIPFLEFVSRGVLVDKTLDHALQLVAGDVGHVTALEDLAAIPVDHAALLVHHVVVLEHAFADQEVLLLHLLLRALDRFGQHLGLERHLPALLVDGPKAVEDFVDAVAGEEADHVVFRGEEEARLTGVALAP